MENEDKKQPIRYLIPEKAWEYFSQPLSTDDDFIKHQKILSQFYDAIINLYQIKKSETYIPEFEEIYQELEFKKKAISDKIPLPEKSEFLKYSFILACHKPAFLAILRELQFDEQQRRFYFNTKYAIPFNGDLNFLQKGISQVLHNSQANFRTHLTEINPTNLLKEKIVNFKSIEELKDVLETGQLHAIFKKIYFIKNQFVYTNENDIYRMNLINQRLKELILKPLIYQLAKEKLILSLKRNLDVHFPDVLLINNLYYIELRFNLLLDLIHHESIKKTIYEKISTNDKILFSSKSRVEEAILLSQFVMTNKDFSEDILLLCSEIISLNQFIESSKKQEKLEQQKIELKQLVDKLSKSNGIYRVKYKDRVYSSPEIIEYILKGQIPQILFATYPVFNSSSTSIDSYEEIYLLLKDKKQIASAIEQAKDLYQKVSDIHFVRILEQILQYHDKSEEEINQILPSYLKEDFEILLSRTYLQDLPFFQRILYKLIGGKLDKKTLMQLWKNYYNKNKLKVIKEAPINKPEKKTEKVKQKQEEELNIQDNELFVQLKQKIEWYIERDIIPTEKVILHDFKENKKELENIFKMIHVGLKSVQEIIPIITKNDVYLLSKEYLLKHKDELLNKYNTKIQELEGIQLKDGKVISLKTEKDKIDLYKNIIKIINKL